MMIKKKNFQLHRNFIPMSKKEYQMKDTILQCIILASHYLSRKNIPSHLKKRKNPASLGSDQ